MQTYQELRCFFNGWQGTNLDLKGILGLYLKRDDNKWRHQATVFENVAEAAARGRHQNTADDGGGIPILASIVVVGTEQALHCMK